MWLNKDDSNITYINEKNKRKINKKKLAILIVISIVIWILASTFAAYVIDEEFRNFTDINILRKSIEEDNVPSIEIGNLNEANVFAYSNYIGVLKDNVLTIYNSSGKSMGKLDVEISSPLIETNADYAVIAENEGHMLYLIYRNEVVWSTQVEGNISRVNVNASGYTSIVVSGTSYKSVIALYNREGTEIIKKYLSSTIAVDTDISIDNKYLSYAEINMAGTLIQSNIKTISIEKAKENPSESTIFEYSADADKLIIDIKYQNRKLVCLFDDSIYVVNNNKETKIVDLADGTITYSDINLNNYVVDITEKSGGMFSAKTTVTLTNSQNEKQNIYNTDGAVKELYCFEDKIGINLGNEVHFIDSNGWLIKKYTTGQEAKKVVIGSNIAGIIQKNKLKIINL